MKQDWVPLPKPLDEFVYFSAYCMRELGLSDKPTTQQCAVCDWMEKGPDRSLTVAFRGLGKSILASFYALWRLRMDPNEKIMVVSATAVKATDFSSSCCGAWVRSTSSTVYFLGLKTALVTSHLTWAPAWSSRAPVFARWVWVRRRASAVPARSWMT